MRAILDNETFIRLWNRADTIRGFMETTGYTYNAACARAYRLRSAGHEMKSYVLSPDFYAEIGRKGGLKGAKDGTIKGFAADRERASRAGRIGGSKRKGTNAGN